MYWSVQVTIKAAYGRGRRVELGLGRYPDIKLNVARAMALEAREAARAGIDPREARRQSLQSSPSFEEICRKAYQARQAELKGDGKAGRWMSPMELHVLPQIGKRPIDTITQNDLVALLEPLWHTKAETARKALTRIGIVFNYAMAKDIDVDAQVVAKTRALLGKSRYQPSHIPAMNWKDVPAFYAELVADPTVAAAALQLLILTGVRSNAVRHAHTDQFDGDVWTIPADNMKGRKGKTSDFRVPLSPAARSVVAKYATGRELFPSPRKGVVSDMAMSQYMKRKGLDARPHGFRTSLRTWLAEATDAPHEVAETVLAHETGGKVVNAYRRTDFFEQRATLMGRWGDHVTGGTGNAVRLVV